MPLFMLLLTVVAVVTTAVSIRFAILRRRDNAALRDVVSRLRSLDEVCLTGLGTGLDAMRRDDLSVRVEPRTAPLQIGASGVIGELEHAFNGMLTRAQGGLAAYNDVAERVGSIMDRTQVVGTMLAGLQSNCLSDLESGLAAMADADLTHRVLPRTTPVPEFEHDVPVISELVRTANGMLDNVQASVDMYNRCADAQSTLVRDMSSIAQALAASSDQLATNAREVGGSSDDVARSAEQLAGGAVRQSTLLEAVSGGANAAVVSANAAHARSDEGVDAATRASSGMATLRASAHDVTEAVTSLADKSSRIGDIVATITAIADQTNLLALNAAIEAARAGDQGRGFAVVADEVRKLAEESQEAAGTIGAILDEVQQDTRSAEQHVRASVEATETGAQLVEDARALFEEIAGSVGDVTARVTDIVSATNEATTVASDAREATEHVAAITQETTASMQEVASASSDLAELAVRLTSFTSAYRIDTDARHLHAA